MHYVSTRGAAPTLGFADALLAGLARDGGLYVPLSLPQWRPDAIRALRGLPYAEAAVRVMTPFVGGDFGPAEIETLTAAAYAGFRHAATAPIAANRRQSVRARAFPRTDAGVQGFRHAVAGPGDESSAAAARRAGDDPRRDVRRYRRGGDRGVRRPVPGRRLHPLSARTRLRRAAPADDDGRQAQRPCAGDRGRVRRLPAHRQGAVRRSRLPRRNAPVGRQFHQLGPHPRADRLLFRRRGRARRAGAGDLLRRSDRQFRRRAGRLLRQAHGAAGRSPHHRHQRERHSRPRAGERALRAQGRQGDPVAVDGHSGVVQLRATSVRGFRPRPGGGGRADERTGKRAAHSPSRQTRSSASAPISTLSASTRPPAPRRWAGSIARAA